MEALRTIGQDARMLVCEKISDSGYIEKAASDMSIKRSFLSERLRIFLANGFNRKTLFKIDTGEEGLNLAKHPLVRKADAVLLNWVNQGMLSLKDIKEILLLGKPVILTMHDMWYMTGICHHADRCTHYKEECGDCFLLGKKASVTDLSHKVWEQKNVLYNFSGLNGKVAFVAVSKWLERKAGESSLLRAQRVEVIPNTFQPCHNNLKAGKKDKIRILFGAARLDDPIKGLETLKETINLLVSTHPELARKLEIAMFGAVKNEMALEGFKLPVMRLGILHGEEEVAGAYHSADILVSASSYETFGATLVEAQAYGCIPVSFSRGGQTDIIDNYFTGYLATYSEDLETRAKNLADGILWAVSTIEDEEAYGKIARRMRCNVENRFSYKKVAESYVKLINHLQAQK